MAVRRGAGEALICRERRRDRMECPPSCFCCWSLTRPPPHGLVRGAEGGRANNRERRLRSAPRSIRVCMGLLFDSKQPAPTRGRRSPQGSRRGAERAPRDAACEGSPPCCERRVARGSARGGRKRRVLLRGGGWRFEMIEERARRSEHKFQTTACRFALLHFLLRSIDGDGGKKGPSSFFFVLLDRLVGCMTGWMHGSIDHRQPKLNQQPLHNQQARRVGRAGGAVAATTTSAHSIL